MKIETIGFCILIIFSFIGANVVDTVLHEYSHKWDFRQIAHNESICFLSGGNTVDSWGGYYRYYFNDSAKAQEQEIGKYTELKAYTISVLIMFIWIFGIVFIFKDKILAWWRI